MSIESVALMPRDPKNIGCPTWPPRIVMASPLLTPAKTGATHTKLSQRIARIEMLSADIAMMSPSVASSSRNSAGRRSEEHTSELQSHSDLVCRLLLEKKKDSPSAASRPHTLPA